MDRDLDVKSSAVHLVAFLLWMASPSWGWKDDTGFEACYTTNEAILKDIPVVFEPQKLPSWINGTLIHNGPGMFEVNQRKFDHVFDGFSKPIAWNFDGSGDAKFSTDFLRSRSYNDSMEINDIAPYLLYMPTTPIFSLFDRVKQFINGYDNIINNVVRVGDEYLYVTDIWKVYAAKSPELWSVVEVEPEVPASMTLFEMFGLSSSHPLQLDAGDPYSGLLTYFVEPVFHGHVIHLCKVLSSGKRDFFASVSVRQVPYMHSFGVSRNYVILFGNPIYINVYDLLRTNSVNKAYKWKPEDGSTIYVVNKLSGKVQTFKTDAMMMTHHVNAYEMNGTIVADFVTCPDPSPLLVYSRGVIDNATARNSLQIHKYRIRRFVFDVKRNIMKQIKTPNFDGLANRLELPKINEKFRFRPYCYIYGLTAQSDKVNFADFRLVKRDLCTGRDIWWGKPGFYVNEPYFVARPGATQEDDGLVFSTILDGRRKVSYLGVFDAKTMTEVSHGYLPTFVPFLMHGRFFPAT